MNSVLIVAAGGGLGAALRHLAARALPTGAGLPLATLAVNLLGSLVLGLVAGLALRRMGGLSDSTLLFLGPGLLGGFTTFSAFSLELADLALRGRWPLALGYAALSVAGGLAAAMLGLALTRGPA